MTSTAVNHTAAPWRLQDAKAQFSALVDNALRGVPQHVTRRGKQAVVVLSQQDFDNLRRGAARKTHAPANLIEHLLAIPKEAGLARRSKPDVARPDLQPREVDFS
jgi:antitoxin Phd